MGKRIRDEPTSDTRGRKKSKQEKRAANGVEKTVESIKTIAPTTSENTSSSDGKAKTKSEKKAKLKAAKDIVVLTNGTVAPAEDVGDAKLLKKAEKKARKRAGGDEADPQAVEAELARLKKKANKKAKRKGKTESGDSSEAAPQDAPAMSANGTGTGSSNGGPAANGTKTSMEVPADGPAYVENSELAALPQSEVDAFLSKSWITITQPSDDNQRLRPLMKFDYLPASEKDSLSVFSSFTSPTPIQAAAWPWLFAGRDVVGVAETGSGKTIAFGLPCVRHIMGLPEKQRSKGVKAVVVSPTRELAQQIFEQMNMLAAKCGLRVCCVYGGVPKPPQQKDIRASSIVVATPGRLKDLVEDGSADLSTASFLVLDEADRMLDKGFEEDIKQIAGQVKPTPSRQTLMFTATWPPSVRELAATFMTNPVRINIGENTTGELRANTRITQKVEVMQPMEKQGRLVQVLKEYQRGDKKSDRILVFCLYKKEAARIEEFIGRKNFRVVGIHGDMSQPKRTENLEAFKSGKSSILVATDVAARGLDIPAVKLVLNYTFPLTAEDYVHRIGRTGRAGQDGASITFFTEQEKPLSGALINVLKAAKQEVPDALLKFGGTVKKKEHGAYGAFYKDVDMTKKATKITFD